MIGLTIRPVGMAEFKMVIDWAADEGWNPGLDDLASFHAADPQGFMIGYFDGEPISSISVVRYGSDFGFLGFYLVRPDRRGSGAGVATWNAGMKHLEGRTVGLDGVVAQQQNYRNSGFKLAGRNVRHMGVVKSRPKIDTVATIRPIKEDDLATLYQYDRKHFPGDRAAFVRDWVMPANGVRRQSLVVTAGGAIFGYGTIRECRNGYKIGPLFADDRVMGEALFSSLTGLVPADAVISLDTPEENLAAMAMAKRAGLEPVFETARMYRGNDPHLPTLRIFGVTSFELG